MGSRSRIRWQKVFKLALGLFGGLALFGGLPSLIRRPEPPPLEPDIGLVPVAASREPGPSDQRPAGTSARREARGRPGGRARDPPRPEDGKEASEGQRRLVAASRPTSRKESRLRPARPRPAPWLRPLPPSRPLTRSAPRAAGPAANCPAASPSGGATAGRPDGVRV